MQGFKSFPNKTDVIFDKGINVVVGPNGSGKSNISDALCFALGRLSIKSMRAAKARNLLFLGSKYIKPAKEATVEIIFDNSKNTFNIPQTEVSIKRILRHDGQSIYKLNGETRTRAEIIETLAHAGIDPYGFNIILQGQIQSLIRLHPEERRKIVEEVAGISIYETRKEKSLHELGKTEERLKEISTILRERTTFLKNLEKERIQALRYKELESLIKRCKASIIYKKIEEKQRELSSTKKSIGEKILEKGKFKEEIDSIESTIQSLNNKISQINKHIQEATGLEQETLKETISNIKAELEGLKVRKENYENRRLEVETRIKEMEITIPDYELEVNELRKKSPLVAKKQEELKKKKKELEKIEEERKNVYQFKTELNNLKERLRDKLGQLSKVEAESNSLLKQIEEYTLSLKYKNQNECKKALIKLKENIQKSKNELALLSKEELEKIKLISSAETKIKDAEKIKQQIREFDVCPICQNKITDLHSKHVNEISDKKIKEADVIIKEAETELKEINIRNKKIKENIEMHEKDLLESERELSQNSLINDKKEYLKNLVEEEKILKDEVKKSEEKKEKLEQKTFDSSRIEEQYNSKILEIEEISSRTEKDLDTALLYKERELEKIREVIKHSKKDLEEISLEIEDISTYIINKNEIREDKEEEDKKINEKFKQMLKERDSLQGEIQQNSHNISILQNELRALEDQINYLKIIDARLNAEKESFEFELKDYPGVEIIKANINILQERFQKAQQSMQIIGSINMRALEIYDEIKEEYDKINEKTETLEKEKSEILKIIEEIDNKKKKTFMKTFNGINDLFTKNCSQLSGKGQAFLEIENKEDIFSGGVNITIKMQRGKYFDATSLSGGEQTLIALSLLFAIQEHKPHHFYIFDEIDASLDKRNSERLSALLRKYIRSGQYILVTHNDAIITDSNFLYGVTMHEGASKILSLKL